MFDRTGENLSVYPLPPVENLLFASIPDGTVSLWDRSGRFGFDLAGMRFDRTTAQILESAGKGRHKHAVGIDPRSGYVWSSMLGGFSLYGPSGEVVRRLDCRPDGRWISATWVSSLDPDGNLVYVDWLDEVFDVVLMEGDGGQALSFTPRDSAPFDIRASRDWALVDCGDYLLLIRREANAREAYELDVETHVGSDDVYWAFPPDPDEVWAIDMDRLVLRRFALPQ